MTKPCTLLLLLLFVSLPAFAQYADSGNGVLKNSVWWFNWNGFTLSNGASKTFTTTDGLNVTITFSNVSGPTPAPATMNTWSGAVLHFLYDFTDPNIRPALLSTSTTQSVAFTMAITATRNGIPAPFTFCAADAEASLKPVENTTLITSGSNWNILEFFRNSPQTSNPLTGCGTQTLIITDTYEPTALPGTQAIGQNPLMTTNAPVSGTLQVEVHMDRTARGGMAVAFGIFAPVDRGDLPSSYGLAQHRWVYASNDQCNYNPPFPSISQSAALKLGNVPGDADPASSLDDNATGVDEDALTTFPDYTGSGNYSLDLPVTNTTGVNAYVSGWFDYDRSGTFEPGERVIVTVPPLATTAHLDWTGLPAKFTHGAVRDFGFRFRISSDQAAVSSASSVATDGEVEDYLAHLNVPCDIVSFPAATVNVCEGASVQLNATPGLLSYNWMPANGLSVTDVADPVATPAANTTYTVMATTDDGCQGSTTITLNVVPLPFITKSADASICAGGNAQLSAASSAANTTFSWAPATGLNNPAIANPIAAPQVTTTYTLTATSNGCTVQENVMVSVRPKRISEVKPAIKDICKGTSLLLEASGGDTYQWLDPDNAPLGANAQLQVSPGQTTVYTVNITDNDCGGTTTLQVPVTVSELNAAVTKSNDINCSTGSAILTASGGAQYQWEPAPGLTNLTERRQVVAPQQTTTYHLTMIDGACSRKDSVTVAVDLTTAISTYPIPTAFTPNRDGQNDCFGLKYWGPVISLEFNVYSRWGVQVFSTHNPQDCWDGSYKGQPLPIGAYVYWIKAKTLCGEVERKGAVTLLK